MNPVILGSGIPLFLGAAKRAAMNLKDSRFQNRRVRAMGLNPVAFVLGTLTRLLSKVFRFNKIQRHTSDPYRKGDHHEPDTHEQEECPDRWVW